MKLNRITGFGAVLVLGANILSARASAVVGKMAPPLLVHELDGKEFDLAALRGKVVVVSFWATWCPDCRQEMPALDEYYRQFHDRGVEMIGLSVDQGRDHNEVRKAMKTVHYPAAMLSDARSNGFGTPNLLPITYVIDSNGVVRARLNPDKAILSVKVLADIVDPLLPSKPAQPAAP